jgi:outer membrane lipoprotein SlyB
MADTKLTPEQLQVQATAIKEVALQKLAKAEEGIERAKKFAASQGRLTKVSAALEKAQAAQAQFNETKAKFEAYKAKAEAAAKRAKELKRKLEETRALLKAVGPSAAGIAGVIAIQIGGMRGKLIAQIQQRVLESLSKFVNECPNAKELQKIIKIKNNLSKNIGAFQKRAQKFKSTAGQLVRIASTVRTAITVIKNIPTPTAIIPPGSPGGLGVPMNILNRYSDKLIQLDKLVEKYTNEGTAILSTVEGIIPPIDNIKNRLDSIDIAIQQCSTDTATTLDLAAILVTAQPKGNTGTEGTPIDTFTGQPDPKYTYKGYTLAVVQDPNSPKVAPRRYAVAKDGRGIVVLKGQPSFSSSTDILLDELKFRIDNQLP